MPNWQDTSEEISELKRNKQHYNRKQYKSTRCQCDVEYGTCCGPELCPYSDVYEEEYDDIEN